MPGVTSELSVAVVPSASVRVKAGAWFPTWPPIALGVETTVGVGATVSPWVGVGVGVCPGVGVGVVASVAAGVGINVPAGVGVAVGPTEVGVRAGVSLASPSQLAASKILTTSIQNQNISLRIAALYWVWFMGWLKTRDGRGVGPGQRHKRPSYIAGQQRHRTNRFHKPLAR